jgi:hypothetical protein
MNPFTSNPFQLLVTAGIFFNRPERPCVLVPEGSSRKKHEVLKQWVPHVKLLVSLIHGSWPKDTHQPCMTVGESSEPIHVSLLPAKSSSLVPVQITKNTIDLEHWSLLMERSISNNAPHHTCGQILSTCWDVHVTLNNITNHLDLVSYTGFPTIGQRNAFLDKLDNYARICHYQLLLLY